MGLDAWNKIDDDDDDDDDDDVKNQTLKERHYKHCETIKCTIEKLRKQTRTQH